MAEQPRRQEPSADTVALLFEQFGDVLIPLENVRARYFRNLSPERFRRVVRTGQIPLPITTLDGSRKAQAYIHITQLADYIEHRAACAADEQDIELPPPHTGAPATGPQGHHHEERKPS